jgi:hypothetical protein
LAFTRKLLQSISSSISSLPIGNIAPHWTQVVAQDFDTPATAGNFLTTYPGFAAFDGFTDTSKQGTYSKNILTAHDSMLDVFIHYDGATDKRYVACVMPNAYNGQISGKATFQMHMDNILQYKIVPLWWSNAAGGGHWSDGELDFPEGGIGRGPFAVNLHNAVGNPSQNVVSYTVPNSSTGPTHIYDLEWVSSANAAGVTPYVKCSLDGVQVVYTTNQTCIPVNPMRLEIQMEVADLSGNTIPDTANQGHVYIDWIAQYTYS